MTFDRDMAQLGRTVARLLVQPEPVQAAHVDTATTGHAALTGLLLQLHRDVAGVSWLVARDRSVHDLERHPVALLGTLLRDQPLMPRQSISDALTAPRSPAQSPWLDLIRHATLAHHEWTGADGRSWPRGDAAWSVLADVGALAQASSHLSQDIAGGLAAAGRDDDAARFLAAARSGLRLAGREVTTLALSGPTQSPDLVPKNLRTIVRVRHPADVPTAMRRATALVRAAEHLSPPSVSRLGVAHARTILNAADALERPTITAESAPTHAALLREHAELVTAAARPDRGIATIHPDDRAPLAQLSAIRQLFTAEGDRWPVTTTAADADALLRYAAAVPDLTAALRDVSTRQVQDGHWLAVQPNGRWRPCQSTAGVPDSIGRWWTAAHHRPSPELERTAVPRGGRVRGASVLAGPGAPTVESVVRDSLRSRATPRRPARPSISR